MKTPNTEPKAYVEESQDSSNYANPLFIVHYPDGQTYSTIQKALADKVAKEFNEAL